MSSIDRNELFEQYYQNKYDFNTASLSLDEIVDIKKAGEREKGGLCPGSDGDGSL